MSTRIKYGLILLFCLGGSLSRASLVRAQDIDWSLNIIGLPFDLSPFLSDIEPFNDNGQVSIVVQYLGTGSPAVYFNYILVTDNTGVASVNAVGDQDKLDRILADFDRVVATGHSGRYQIPTGPYFESFTPRQIRSVVHWSESFGDQSLRSVLQTSTLQTNALPEGTHTLYAWISTEPQGRGELLAETTASVQIVTPDPVELLQPTDGEVITEANPSFIWYPVITPYPRTVRYRIRMVEVFENLSPEQALQALGGESVQFETIVESANAISYPTEGEALPLEHGKTYAWVVESLNEDDEPLFDDFQSEVWTFTYQDPAVEGAISLLNPVANPFAVLQADESVLFSFSTTPQVVLDQGNWDGLTLQLFSTNSGEIDPVVWFQELDDAQRFDARMAAPGVDERIAEVPILPEDGVRQRVETIVPDAEGRDQALAWRIVGRLNGLPIASTPALALVAANEDHLAGGGIIGAQPVLDRVVILADMATLTGFERAQIVEEAAQYRINGPARLDVRISGQTLSLPVQLSDLVVDSNAPDRILSGAFDGIAAELADAKEALNGIFVPRMVRWSFDGGVAMEGDLKLPGDGPIIESRGSLALTPGGLEGVLASVAGDDPVLFSWGSPALSLQITTVEARFPAASLTGTGRLGILGAASACDMDRIDLAAARASFDVDCDANLLIQPFDKLIPLSVSVGSITGNLTIDFGASSVSYDVRAEGQTRMALQGGPRCDSDITLRFQDAQGVSLEEIGAGCAGITPMLSVDDARLILHGFSLESLSFGDGGNWDFAFATDLEIAWPNVALPILRGLTLGSSGLSFPALQLNEEDFRGFQPLVFGMFNLEWRGLETAGFDVPWADLGGNADEPFAWDLGFDFALTLRGAPDCLQHADLSIRNARIQDGALHGELPATAIAEPGCPIPLGPGFALNILELGGTLALGDQGGNQGGGGANQDGNGARSGLELKANLQLGAPFTCDADRPLSLGEAALTLTGDGLIDGTVDHLVPDCPLRFGGLEARISDATITFGDADGSQTAMLTATAVLDFPDARQASGTLRLNLVTGEIEDMSFEIEGPFTWNLPTQNPALRFRIDRARFTMDGLTINGRQQLLLDGAPMGVTFDQFVFDPFTFSVRQGRIIFDEAFAFVVSLGGNGDAQANQATVSFRAVPFASQLEADTGALFGLSGEIVIDQQGLHSDGEARAAINFQNRSMGGLTARFSRDFRMQFMPFGVANGQVDWLYNGDAIAFADADGFHPDLDFWGRELIPDVLPLPVADIAFLRLKNDRGDLLIDTASRPDGSVCLNTRPGTALELVLPGLDPADPPRADVTLQDVCIDPMIPALVSGEVRATPPAGDQAYDLSRSGIPLAVESITARVLDNVSVLQMDGRLILFGQDLGENASITASVFSDGNLEARIDLNRLGTTVPLIPGSDRLSMVLNDLSGEWNVPLAAPQAGIIRLEMDGDLELRANGQRLGAGIGASYTERGFALTRFEPDAQPAPFPIDLGPIDLSINSLERLDLSFAADGGGFDFRVRLNMDLDLDLGGGSSFSVNLPGVALTPSGFAFPRIEVNNGTMPRLAIEPFDLGGLSLEPQALRFGPFDFNWFDFAPGDGVDLGLSFDLSLRLPDPFLDLNPPDGFTLADFSFGSGVFEGSLEGIRFPNPIDLNIGGALSYRIRTMDISLFAVDGGQSFSLATDGSFFDGVEGCAPTLARLSLLPGGGVSGRVAGLAPCETLEMGPLTLEFESSDVDFAVQNGEQEATLNGVALLGLPGPNGRGPNDQRITARGNLTMNLLTGEMLDGAIEVEEPFTWSLPSTAESPFLTFTVNRARLDPQGFLINGNGSIQAGDQPVDIRLNDLLFDLDSFGIQSGNATIAAVISIETGLNPMGWELVDPESAFIGQNRLRMTLPGNLTIDRNGMTIAGGGEASLRYQGESYGPLVVTFNDLQLGLGPVEALEGEAVFQLGESVIARYNSTGFHIDAVGLIAGQIPARIGLPTEDIAYLQLRDPDTNELFIEQDRNDDGWTLSTRRGLTVDLVLASLARPGSPAPTIRIGFANVGLDDGFNMTSGAIRADLQDAPLDLSEIVGLPVELTGLAYARAGGFQMRAQGRMQLPQSLGGLDIEIEDLLFDSLGVASGIFEIGNYTEPDAPDLQNIYNQAFGNLTLHVGGARFEFGQNIMAGFSGTLESPVLKDGDENRALLFYDARYRNGAWAMTLDASHLPEGIPIGVGQFNPNPRNGLRINLAPQFALNLSGTLSMPDVLGEDFLVTISDLNISSGGVSFGNVELGRQVQQVDLINDLIRLQFTRVALAYQNNVLSLGLDGRLWFKPFQNVNSVNEAILFTGFTVDTEGNVDWGEARANLLADGRRIHILGREGAERVYIDQLLLSGADGRLQLESGGAILLPEPFVTNGRGQETPFNFTVDTNGNIVANSSQLVVRFGRRNFIGDNPDTEFKLGSIATIDLKEVGLDLRNLREPALFVNASIYLKNNTRKIIQLGEVGQSGDRAGFYYPFGGAPRWNVSANGLNADLDLGLLRLTVAGEQLTVRSNGSDFALKLGGEIRLTHPGVSGHLGWNNLTISTEGLESMGSPDAAGGASFTLMDIVSLEVGSLTMGDGPLTIDGDPIQTTSYLRLADARLSLTDAIQGGVEEVLFYRTEDGELFLRIRNVNLQLGGNGNAFSLAANLEYISDRNGYVLRASGNTEAAGVGSLTVAGIIRNRGGLSFGLIVVADSGPAGVPIIPGILSITGIGGGFFYRPTRDDIDFVTQENVLGFDLNGAQPDVSQLQFAVLLYGSAGILANVLRIKTLVQITDRYTKVDADGYFYSRIFEAEMFLTVEYGDGTLVHGGVSMSVDYSPVMSGTASLDFFIAWQQGRLDWAVLGRVNNFRMLFIRARGQFMISDSGFLVDLSVDGSVDFKIITIRGSFEASVWAIRGQSWGAYAEIDVRASVLGGAAAIGANLKGALIVDDGYLLFAAARAYVEVLWVFSGRISVWMSLRNGDFDGGTGRNRRFERMIAEARGQRDDIQRKANQTRQALENAFENINSFALSPEQLRRAGYTLLMADVNERRRFGDMILRDEQEFLNASENGPVPDYNRNGDHDADDRRMWRSFKNAALQQFQGIRQRLIVAENGRPTKQPVENAQAAVQGSMEGLEGIRDEVAERFQQLQLSAVQFQEEADEAALGLRNPVQANWPHVQGRGTDQARINWGAGGLFSINSQINTANAGKLSDLRAAAGAADGEYRRVISGVLGNLERLDALIMNRQVFQGMGATYVDPMTGRRLELGQMVNRRNLNDFAEMYYQTYEQTSEYYSRFANYLWELREWAVSQRSAFHGQLYGVRGAIGTTRSALYVKGNGFVLGRTLAFSRKRMTHLLLHGCTLTCPDRETFDEADQAAGEFREELSALMDVMDDDPGARARFSNLFEESGVELWQGVIRSGLEAVVDTTEARIEGLRGQYQTQLSNIGRDHRRITDKIQRLYVARSNLAATLYGMIDAYISWREGTALAGQAAQAGQNGRPGAGNNNPYRALRSELAASLDPPNLSAIRVQTTDPGFMTHSTITWTARHPQGVLETSFDLSSQNGAYSLTPVGLRSLGSRRRIDVWSFMPNRIQGTREIFNVTLRARSVSGTTSQRRGSFRVSYSTGGVNTDDGVDISIVDDTPPTPPAISFPNYQRHGIWQMIGPRGRERPVSRGQAYWGSQTDNLTLTLASVDPETDVSVFEVAIGSRPGRDDIRAWDAVYGERILEGNNANAIIRTTIRGLSLIPGRQYFVSARARNGEGNLSPVSRFPKPLIVDNTPPSEPGRPARGLIDINRPDRYRVQVRWPSYRDIPVVRQDAAPERVAPSIDVAWTVSSDDESGFRRYEYALHTEADAASVFEGQTYVTSETSVTLDERKTLSDGTGWTYGTTLYVSVRALNYAGGYSQTLVLGPYTVTDPSPPTSPKVSARWYRYSNKVYLTSVSVDPETDIEKYQYAYGTVAGRTDLRTWTDVPVNRLRSSRNNPPYFTTTARGVEAGRPFFVSVRAVNRQGAASRITATGPVILDSSGPPDPGIGLSLEDNDLRMLFRHLRDPESGILQLEYRIELQDLHGTRTLVDWTSILRPFRPLMMDINNMARTVRLNLRGGGLSIRVRVRVTNGYGLRRTYTRIYSLANRAGLGGFRVNLNR